MSPTAENPKHVSLDPPVEIGTPQRRPSRRNPPANQRFGAKGLTVCRILGGLAFVASVLLISESWLAVIVFGAALIYLCSEVLVEHLPWSLSSAMKRNCIRQDGSWSTKRAKTELFAIEKLRWDIRMILLLVLVPTTMLVWVIDREVIPLNIGLSSLASFQPSDEGWRANLVGEEHLFNKWANQNSSGFNVEQHKRILWRLWPVACIGAMIWFVGCWLAIRRTFLSQLKELSGGVERRGLEYIQYDRARGTFM